MTEKPINYIPRMPVIGDIHGNLDGLVNTVEYMQQASGEHYPFVIQLGDFGYFPEKHFETSRDELELGVNKYLNNPKDLAFKIIFIRGNHEDQISLKELSDKNPEGIVVADKSGSVLYLADGRFFNVQVTLSKDVTFGAFGGVEKESRPRAYKKNPLVAHSDTALDKLLDFKCLDILLTHQGPDPGKKGCLKIKNLIELMRPRIHLYGHSHDYQFSEISGCKSYGLSKMPHSKRPFKESNMFYGILDLEKMQFSLGVPQPLNHQAI